MMIACTFDTYVDIEAEVTGETLAALQSTPQTISHEEGNLTITHDGHCMLEQFHDRMTMRYHGEWSVIANIDPGRPSDKKLYHGVVYVRDSTTPEVARKELEEIGMQVGQWSAPKQAFEDCYAIGAMLTQMRFGGKRYRFIAYVGNR